MMTAAWNRRMSGSDGTMTTNEKQSATELYSFRSFLFFAVTIHPIFPACDYSVSFEIYKKARRTPWGRTVGRREFPQEERFTVFPWEVNNFTTHSSVGVADHKRSLAVPSWCWAVSLKFTVRLLPVMLSPRYPLALFLLLLSSHCQHCSQLRPQQFSTDLDQNAALQTNSLIDSDLQLLSLLVNATLLAGNTQLATTEDPELDMTTVNSNPKLL